MQSILGNLCTPCFEPLLLGHPPNTATGFKNADKKPGVCGILHPGLPLPLGEERESLS
jgi:hypothetical protein